jgi:hypothetical protein
MRQYISRNNNEMLKYKKQFIYLLRMVVTPGYKSQHGRWMPLGLPDSRGQILVP